MQCDLYGVILSAIVLETLDPAKVSRDSWLNTNLSDLPLPTPGLPLSRRFTGCGIEKYLFAPPPKRRYSDMDKVPDRSAPFGKLATRTAVRVTSSNGAPSIRPLRGSRRSPRLGWNCPTFEPYSAVSCPNTSNSLTGLSPTGCVQGFKPSVSCSEGTKPPRSPARSLLDHQGIFHTSQ